MYQATRFSSRQLIQLRRFWKPRDSKLNEINTLVKTLPPANDLISQLPDALRDDGAKLTSVLDEAQTAIKTAAEESSDSEDRNFAMISCRNAIDLYNELAARAGPIPEKEQSTITNTIQQLSNHNVNITTNTTAATKTDDNRISKNNTIENKTDNPSDNETEKNQVNYKVPSPNDSQADYIVNSPNPVVRVFGPHVADMKYGLFVSQRQRVWIGWSGWF